MMYGLSARLPDGLRACCATGSAARGAHISWALSSLEAFLKPMYAGTALAWSKAQKRRELRAPEQRLVFVAAGAGGGNESRSDGGRERKEDRPDEPVGFLSYRVDSYDEERSDDGGEDGELEYVVYVYEVVVAPCVRRMGLARALLELLERICTCAGVLRIVLTVFDSNVGAIRLYKECLGYTNDESCPSKYGVVDAKYQILTKKLHRGRNALEKRSDKEIK